MTIFAPLPNSTNASVLKQKDTMLTLNNYSNFSSLYGTLFLCGIIFMVMWHSPHET